MSDNPKVVWIGIFKPAPESIPRPDVIEHVFDSEDKAWTWAREWPERYGESYRAIKRMVVE